IVSDDYGVVVMAASLGREYAMEGSDAEHGYFTRALLEGLSGAADYNRDRPIHLYEADRAISGRGRQFSSGKQKPPTGRPTGVRSSPITGVKSPLRDPARNQEAPAKAKD